MSIVKGHGLVQEGKALSDKERCQLCLYFYRIRIGTGGEGHGRCSCGAISPHLHSGAERKRWHRDHKREMQDA